MRDWQIGVDLGGTTFSVACIDTSGNIKKQKDYQTHAYQGPQTVLERIAAAIRDLLAELDLAPTDVRGIGIGMPGLHDTEQGVCLYAANLKWHDVPVKKPFEDWFGVPVTIENDVRCAALGERHFGAAQDVDDMVLITLGTGVGGAVILGGRLQRGGSGFAGEVGHQTIDPDGRLCACGNYGCLEAYAGTAGIVERAKALYNRFPSEWVRRAAGDDLSGLTPRLLSEAAAQGDLAALQVWEETGRYIGIGLANVVSLFNPKKIVVGGGVARAGEILLKPMRDEIRQRVPVLMADTVEVVPAVLGSKAGVVGASTLVWSPVV